PDGVAQLADVAQIGFDEATRPGLPAESLDQAPRRGAVEIDEADPRALRHEVLDDARPDPGGAAGHQHAAIAQAGVGRKPAHSAPPARPRGARALAGAPGGASRAALASAWRYRGAGPHANPGSAGTRLPARPDLQVPVPDLQAARLFPRRVAARRRKQATRPD